MVLALLDCDWFAYKGTSCLGEASEEVIEDFKAMAAACSVVKVLQFPYSTYIDGS